MAVRLLPQVKTTIISKVVQQQVPPIAQPFRTGQQPLDPPKPVEASLPSQTGRQIELRRASARPHRHLLLTATHKAENLRAHLHKPRLITLLKDPKNEQNVGQRGGAPPQEHLPQLQLQHPED